MGDYFANYVHERQAMLADEAQAIAADLSRLRRVRDVEGLGLVRQAMAEALQANKKLSALVAAGGLDIRSTLFPQTVRAADRRALRVAALGAVLDKSDAVRAVLAETRAA